MKSKTFFAPFFRHTPFCHSGPPLVVIPSERRESRDLRIMFMLSGDVDASAPPAFVILRLTPLGMTTCVATLFCHNLTR